MRKYVEKTFQKLLKDKLNQIPNTLDKREGSLIYDAMAPNAKELEEFYKELDWVLEQSFVDTATGEYLELRTKERAVDRKPAVETIRHLKCEGKMGEIKIGARFLIDGVYFRTVEAGAIPCVVQIKSEQPGRATVVEYSAEVLSLEGIAGLDRASLVYEHEQDFNGVDAESDEALRERYYITVRRTPGSGNIDDYMFWAGEVVGVGKSIVIPLWNGNGTVKVILLDSNGDPASPGLIENVKNYIDPDPSGEGMGKAPIGAQVTFEPAVAKPVNVCARVILTGKVLLTDIEKEVREALVFYVSNINLYATNRRVIYNKVGAIVVDAAGVIDFEELLINGQDGNIVLEVNEVPVVGTVEIHAV